MRKSGRRVIGQIWPPGEPRPDRQYLEAGEIDPDREHLAPLAGRFLRGEDAPLLTGGYFLRLRGAAGSRDIDLQLLSDRVGGGGVTAHTERREAGRLAWSAGPEEAVRGELTFLCNPLNGAAEFHGQVTVNGGVRLQCFGSRLGQPAATDVPPKTTLPRWLVRHLASLSAQPVEDRPPFLWQKWEKHHLTSRVVNSLGLLA